MELYVGNLSFEADEQDLISLFEQYGEVSTVSVPIDSISGRSQGFGFVEMPIPSEAQAAMNALNQSEFQGRKLVVEPAKHYGAPHSTG